MTRITTGRGPLERMARTSLRESGSTLRRLERACTGAVAAAAEVAITCLQNGGTVYFCGNGGSAADAQHLACELSGRFLMDRPSLPAVALSTNTSSLTAIGNDYSYDHVFSRQLEGLGKPGDLLVAITTSGGSNSVLRAVQVARRLGMVVIGVTGAKGARFAARCDVSLITPSFSTPRIQEGHIAMGHVWCELIERSLFGGRPTKLERRAAGPRVVTTRPAPATRPRRASRR